MDPRLLTVGAVVLAASLLALPLDFDRDGLSTVGEWRHATAVLDGDSDDDGAPDGTEVRLGSDARRGDSDGDGLLDGTELAVGGDPRSPDTDDDGIPDGTEPDADCDGDGHRAIASPDDDADGRLDGTEPAVARCDPDADDDGVLDGAEGNPACVLAVDCDLDGLRDGTETGDYDPLDPDSFSAGVPDSVTRAFAEAGQPPSADADHDGIPDGWEDAEGLIAWGPYDPSAGTRDLLVEYVKVVGPSSGRFDLDFTPAYEAVAAMFQREDGIRVQWTQTTVRLDTEVRPDFLTEETSAHYKEVLAEAIGTQNPYVTSVVLNPQQVQEDLAGDVLGAAFLRSMIVTVDYGAHSVLTFQDGGGDGLSYDSTANGPLRMSPVLESHIIGARVEQVRQLAAQSDVKALGVTADGRVYYTIGSGDPALGDLTWSWTPDWFVTSPRVVAEDGSWYQFGPATAQVSTAGLAGTIAHELGHTLGLCHAHEMECALAFSTDDFFARDRSTMSYNAPIGTLHFLASEWSQVDAYLACPPQGPIALVAKGIDGEALYAAKYEASFTSAVDLRACGDFTPLPRTLEPVASMPYASPVRASTPHGGWAWFGLYVAATVAAAALAVRR